MFSDAPFLPSDVISLSQILHDWGLPKKMVLIRKVRRRPVLHASCAMHAPCMGACMCCSSAACGRVCTPPGHAARLGQLPCMPLLTLLSCWRAARLQLTVAKSNDCWQAYEALPPGGALVVVERLIDEGRRENTSGLGQSLVMLLEFGEENAFDFTFR